MSNLYGILSGYFSFEFAPMKNVHTINNGFLVFFLKYIFLNT